MGGVGEVSGLEPLVPVRAPAVPGAREHDGDIDLAALGRALWAKRRSILAPTLVALAITFVAVNLMTPVYRAKSRILIENRENAFFRPEIERNTAVDRTLVDPEAVTSQVQILLSRDLGRQVVTELHLADKAEFDAGSLVSNLLRLVGLGRDDKLATEERVLRAYFERLKVYPIEKSRVIAIEFEIPRSRSRGQGRQRGGRGLSRAPAACQAGLHPSGVELAAGRDREAAQEGGRRRRPRRSLPLARRPVRRGQQHPALQPAARRAEHPARRRPHPEDGSRVEGADDPRDARLRPPHRGVRRHQFRADPPARRAEHHAQGAPGRTVLDAAQPAPAHQGAAGPDRRPRQPDPRRGRAHGARVRERRPDRRRPPGADRARSRPAQAAGRRCRRAGRAVAGAGARSEGRARPARNPIWRATATRRRATRCRPCRRTRASSRAPCPPTCRPSPRRCR